MFCAGILEPTISACASRQNSAVVAAAGAPDLRLASGAERLPNGKAPTYEVSTSIMAVVRGSVSLSQSFFSFGLFKPNTPKSLTTRLTSNDPSFKLSPELVSVTLKGRDTAEWDRAQYFQATVRPVPSCSGNGVASNEPRSSGVLVADTPLPVHPHNGSTAVNAAATARGAHRTRRADLMRQSRRA